MDLTMHSIKSVPKQNKSLIFEAIGTQWQIDIESKHSIRPILTENIHQLIDTFDINYSRFRKDSWVWQLNQEAGSHTLPNDAKPLLDLYAILYKLTDGLVTPLIGQTLSDAGYDINYSLKPKVLSHPPAWEDVMKIEGSSIETTQPLLLDLGAAGKGYLVDKVSNLLDTVAGIQSYCVDAGGDMFYRNLANKSITVGLEHPDNIDQVIGIVNLSNRAICGSAGNKRAWPGYHHILNPHTLQSPTNIKAIWTIADTTMLADGLSTCLFFVKPQVLAEYNYEYLIIYKDNHYDISPQFPGELFTMDKTL